MDFTKKKITNYFLYDTQVDNLFLGEYMLDAPGDYVKVYLLALLHAQIGDPIDSISIAKRLSLSVESVDKAWDYWESKGVARKLQKAPTTDAYTVEINNLKEIIFGKCAVDTMGGGADASPINLTDGELSKLLSDIQEECGRLLEAREPETVASWVSDFGIAPDVILASYKYCTEKGRSNRYRYVEKILLDWNEKGLKTAAMVMEYLEQNDKQYELYRRIMKELGFRRNPSEPEKRIMKKWFSEMGFGLDDVLSACKATTGISSPNINYVDSVLVNRYQKAREEKEGTGNSYSKIQALYQKTREENAEKTAKRRHEIVTLIPRLGQILEEQKDFGYKLAKAMLAGNKAEVEGIRSSRDALEAEKKQLLIENGLNENVLDPIYTCKKCQDTGVLEDGGTCSCYAEKLMLIK